jgi:hypothetical protein
MWTPDVPEIAEKKAKRRIGETAKVDGMDVSVDVLKLPAAVAVSAPVRIRRLAHSPIRPFAVSQFRLRLTSPRSEMAPRRQSPA